MQMEEWNVNGTVVSQNNMHSDQLLFHMETCDINHKPLFTSDNFLTTVYGFQPA